MIAELAGAQHGVVARRQLLERGLTRHVIADRLASGHLHAVHRGVYAVGHTSLTARSRWQAAALSAGPGAVLSHRTAAAVWDLRPDRRTIVDVTTPRGSRSRRGILVHRAALPAGDVAVRDGLPVTAVHRTISDLATVLDVRALTRLIERAEVLRVLDASKLRPRGRLRAALAGYDPRHERTRFELERRALSLVDVSGLPRPEVNALVAGYEVDLLWREQGIVLELDGWATHGTRTAFERDRARDRSLARHGVTVLRGTWASLAAAVGDVVALYRASDASACSSSRAAASPSSSERSR